MIRYLINRSLWLLIELVGVSLITFVLAFLVPADPARMYAGPHASLATVANIRHQLGLDRPLWVQYLTYLWNLLHLDLGMSYELHMPVLQAIVQRIPATAELALAGVFFELLIGVPIGLLAALSPRGIVDRFGMALTLVGVSTPSFVVCYVLIYGVWFKLGLSGAAFYARLLRNNLQDILHTEYVRVGRAKGLSAYKVLLRHALPNAMNALLTQLGLDIGFFLSGVLLVEVPFSWPGIGRQAWEAITNLDIPLVLGTVLFGAVTILVANIVVDIAYAFLDPRVRYG